MKKVATVIFLLVSMPALCIAEPCADQYEMFKEEEKYGAYGFQCDCGDDKVCGASWTMSKEDSERRDKTKLDDRISALEKKVKELEQCACLQPNYNGDVSKLFPPKVYQQNN
jgi:hypothetical protein